MASSLVGAIPARTAPSRQSAGLTDQSTGQSSVSPEAAATAVLTDTGHHATNGTGLQHDAAKHCEPATDVYTLVGAPQASGEQLRQSRLIHASSPRIAPFLLAELVAALEANDPDTFKLLLYGCIQVLEEAVVTELQLDWIDPFISEIELDRMVAIEGDDAVHIGGFAHLEQLL